MRCWGEVPTFPPPPPPPLPPPQDAGGTSLYECFPGSAMVHLRDGSEKRMRELKVDDSDPDTCQVQDVREVVMTREHLLPVIRYDDAKAWGISIDASNATASDEIWAASRMMKSSSVRAGDIVFVTRGVNVAPGPKGDAGRLVPTRVRMVQETPTAMALGLYNPHVRSGKITVDSCAGPLKLKQRAITTALWTRTSCTRAASASPVAVVAAVVVAGCFGQCHNKVYICKTLIF